MRDNSWTKCATSYCMITPSFIHQMRWPSMVTFVDSSILSSTRAFNKKRFICIGIAVAAVLIIVLIICSELGAFSSKQTTNDKPADDKSDP